MKLSFIGLLLAASVALGQTPNLVRVASGENSRTAQFSSPIDYYVNYVDSVIGGNCGGVFVEWNNAHSSTLTVSDDQGNSYAQAKLVTGPSYSAAVWVAPNLIAGTHQIHLHFSDQTANITPITFEEANCATSSPVDVASGQQATGTSISATSLTPTASGEMILQFAAFQNGSVPATSSMTVGSQSNISWALRIAELLDGIGMQYGVYSSTSAINPTFTTGTSNDYISIAIALKTASSGGVPTGMYIRTMQHVSMYSVANGGPGYANPSVEQFPCTGNLLVVTGNGGSPISSVSESSTPLSYVNWGNSTYPPSYIGTGASETEEVFYAGSHTCNNANTFSIVPNLTYTGTGYDYDFTVIFFDIAGAAASPLDSAASVSGSGNSMTVNGTITGPTLTPSQAGELIINTESEWYGGVNSISGGGILDSFYALQNGGPTNMSVDEQNGFEHYLDATTSPHTVVWTLNYAGSGFDHAGYYAGVAVAFAAATATPTSHLPSAVTLVMK